MDKPDRTWIVELYRDGSLSTILLERVKHVWTEDSGRLLIVAQYDIGHSGSHHYSVWRTAKLTWWRMKRTLPKGEV